MVRIIAGMLVMTIAMAWACFFITRAHFAQDEFKRQREISASFWGGWFGIAASAPIFFFIAIGGLRPLEIIHVQPLLGFTIGYLIAPICGFLGTVGARLWLRRLDAQQ
jgi:TRAP-type C4-dicarboxylate transport system permease large subunit